MNIDKYVEDSMRTDIPEENHAVIIERLSKQIRLLHALIGMVTEVGELTDQFKRHIWYGEELDLVHMSEEAGDEGWYFALLLDVIHERAGIKPSDTLQKNINKLKARYPEKFTEARSMIRDLKTEREVLEAEI